MEQGNFKKFKCEDGKEYIFNYKAFKMELKKAALIAKKTGFMSTIEDFKEGLAGAISVSVSAIKQWETGRNGVSDLERVKEIANYLGLEDYKKLLVEQVTEERKDESVMNNCFYEEERKAAREVFNGLVDIIKVFKDTDGYAECNGTYGAPANEEILNIQNEVESIIQKARFDIPEEIHKELTYLFFEITSLLPNEIEADNAMLRSLKVEDMADTFFQRLCKIMKNYVK